MLATEGGGLFSPVDFVHVNVECPYLSSKKSWADFPLVKREKDRYLLPDLSSLSGKESFATLRMGWNEGGLELEVEVAQPFGTSCFPSPDRGDSVELFIDTRDLKEAGFPHRFCHHFYFLPKEVSGHLAGEITRFRTEDAHEWCVPEELNVRTDWETQGYLMKILIPSSCLQGYDPQQFGRMGFTYRVNRGPGVAQHFSVETDRYQIDQQPSLWSSVHLVK